MKPFLCLRTLATVVIGLAHFGLGAADWTSGMKEGSPEFKSMGPITFGPDGILFIADTKAAAVIALATADTHAAKDFQPLKIEGINQKIAALLGTSADQILIDDLAVNPVSRQSYLAVSRGTGPNAIPVLLKVSPNGQLSAVSMEKVRFSRTELPNAPADAAVGSGDRKRNLRMESITDIAFYQDRVLVAGLSNEEFASTLRTIPFPFPSAANAAGTAGVEIYHGAHGQFETRSPVRTFVPMNIGNKPTLLAAYTCTPLVEIPLSDLKAGAKVKGKTIAELGNRNRPIDMIVYRKDGKDFLLLANSSRGIMKISTDGIEAADSITSPVGGGGIKGQPFQTIDGWTGVDQLDKYDAAHALVLRKSEGGAQVLESRDLP